MKNIDAPVSSAATPEANLPEKTEPATTENVKFDMRGYQKRLAQQAGVKEVSRNYLATLIGEPSSKLVVWDKRGMISGDAAVKFADLEERVIGGKTKLAPPKRGTKPGSTRKAKAPRAARKNTSKAPETAGTGKVDVRKLRESAGLSLAAFAKALGVSVGTVQNWQKGATPKSEARARLQVFAAKATSGVSKGSATPSPVAKSARVDVKKLRMGLGLSRADFSKQVGGASAGAIANWETGKSVPASKYAAKLTALVAKVKSGVVASPAAAAKPAKSRAQAAVTATSLPDHHSLARMLFETAIGCSDATRDRLLSAAAALLGE